VLLAIVTGGVFVAVVDWLNHVNVVTAKTFTLLLPGIIVACMSPDAACSAEGDLHPPGIVAMILERIVNVGFYGRLAYVVIWTFRPRVSIDFLPDLIFTSILKEDQIPFESP
jgi:hypothetical protein